MAPRLYHVCADVLVMASQLGVATSAQSSGEVRHKMRAALDRMIARGQRRGFSSNDMAEAQYALVAFIDEQVMRSSWSGRSEWMSRPMQLELYRESTAGENFFVRLRAHIKSGSRKAVVEVFYMCLLFGFAGAYGDSGDMASLEKFKRAARQQVVSELPPPDKISPHGQRRGAVTHSSVGWAPLLATLGGALMLCCLVLFGLGWATSDRLEEVVSEMRPAKTQIQGGVK